MSAIKNITIVGAAGQAGSHVLSSLLASKKFNLTVITRDSGSRSYPEGITVHNGSYTSPDFLRAALEHQDVLIIALAATAPKENQSGLIEAAAAAHVPWVLPCEFSPDTGNPKMVEGVSILAAKKAHRDHIESLGVSSWIAVVTGPWFDFSLSGGIFGLDIQNRTARLFDEGTTKISTTTLPQLGLAVCKLLSLPPSTLEQFRNNFVYVNSFHVSQLDMLGALKKATGTGERDWDVTEVNVDEAIARGRVELAKGNRRGMMDVLYGMNFKLGCGGNFERKSANEILGLEEEYLNDIVAEVVRRADKVYVNPGSPVRA